MWKEGRRGGQRGEQGPERRGLTDHSKEFKFILGVVGNHGGWEESRTGKLFTINVQAALRRKGCEDRWAVGKGGGGHHASGETWRLEPGWWQQRHGGSWVLKCSEG